MDVISIFRQRLPKLSSFRNINNENQIENIWKINKKPVLCLDGDIAGKMLHGDL